MIEHRSAFARSAELVLEQLRSEFGLIWRIIVVVFFSNLFLVSIPFFIQLLVNHYFNLNLTGPLWIIALLVFGLLFCSYLFVAINHYFAEILKRRLFIKCFYDISSSVRNFDRSLNHYQVARFLEISHIKEELVRIVFDISTTIIVLFFGSIIIISYHPYFFFYCLLLIAVAISIFLTVYPRALTYKSIISDLKFRINERLIRNAEQAASDQDEGKDVDDYFSLMSAKYLTTRAQYFRIILYKNVMIGIMIPAAQALFIIICGQLIFDATLSIGQFVSAELILTYILSSLKDLVKNLEYIMNLVVSLDKIDSVKKGKIVHHEVL